MPTSTDRLEWRNGEVDVLRGVAILMVMLLHFSETYRT